MIFLSELLRATVVDVRQHTLGTVRDLVAKMGDPYPRVTALAVSQRGREPLLVPWSTVRQYTEREISLREPQSELAAHQPAEEELYLSRDVLDKQLIDTDGRRVVRVNDLQLANVGGKLLVVGVDIGGRGLLRRLGMEELGKRAARVLHRDWAQKFIAWDTVEAIRGDGRNMRLRMSYKKVARLHPADIADIVEQMSNADRQALFASLDDETAADTLEETDETVQAQILERLTVERAADILEAMAPDEAADLLADLTPERRSQLIAEMQAEEAGDVQELLAYEEDTAGGLMTPDYVAIPQRLTAAKAIERIRELEPEAESIYYIFVTDSEERLRGVLSLRDLIVAKPETPVAQFMIRKVFSVPLDASSEEVASVLAKYNLLAIPVVDEQDRIQGIVTVDDVLAEVLPPQLRRRVRAGA
ncbi:MAG: magnesium transporter MgtE N-terminal domain-containing protein [Candidatus Dormibacteria bacterium]